MFYLFYLNNVHFCHNAIECLIAIAVIINFIIIMHILYKYIEYFIYI